MVTALVAAASLVVSIASLMTARDTSETREAIAGLSRLAKAAARQADEVHNQLGEMRNQTAQLGDQAKAAQGQLDNAKAQTKAISEQTTAIKNTSAAAIRSADAQTATAVISARAQMPRVSLGSMSIDGIDGAPDPKGYVKATLNLEFDNNGGGAFVQKTSTFGIYLNSEMTSRPPETALTHWGDNNYVVGPGKNLAFTHPPEVSIPSGSVDLIKNGKLFAFVVGTLNYQDGLFNAHAFCFAYKLSYRDGSLRDPFPVSLPAVHCDQ